MNAVLLLGAGFSRNWGGWLASEAFEYLLGCPEIDAYIRERLLSHKNTDGFEGMLGELQEEAEKGISSAKQRLKNFENALTRMFKDMNAGLAGSKFDSSVEKFLISFDIIFTLNQDLLIERSYLDRFVALSSYRRWSGWQIPGMKLVPAAGSSPGDPKTGKWIPDPPSQIIQDGHQPYIKLHGSSNWTDASGTQLIVMGINKTSIIHRYPIIKWYHEQFKEYLARPQTRLMVIGYSFGDKHINDAILDAADLKIFIIDPLGVDAIRDSPQANPQGLPLLQRLWQNLRGASRRSFREIFGEDGVEHRKVMNFLA